MRFGVVSREPRHHPLMLLSYAFGTCPPHPSPRSRTSVFLAVDLVRGRSRKSHRTGARLHLDSSGMNHRDRKRPRCVLSRRHRRDRSVRGRALVLRREPVAPGFGRSRDRSTESLRSWVPPTLASSRATWPRATPRGAHLDRPGLPHPTRPVSRTCRPYFMPERPWAPTLQRFPSVRAARSSRIRLSSLPFPALRRRGSEDLS